MPKPGENRSRSEGLSDSKRKLLEQRLRGKATGAKPTADTIKRQMSDGLQPASPGQQWIYVAQESVPLSAGFNISSSFNVLGDLDLDVLETCLNRVIDRHAILKSHFQLRGGEVEMIIDDSFRLKLSRIKCPNPDELAARSDAFARQPLDLKKGPLLRVHHLREPGGAAVLMLVIHDIIFDKWSLGLFWTETAAFYRESVKGVPAGLPPLEIQYGDFAHWQIEQLSGGRMKSQLDYWKRRLADLPQPLTLPTDRPYPSELTDPGRLERHRLSPKLAERLKRFAAGRNASLFMVTLLAFQILLSRASGSKDVIVGSPVANRRRKETANLIGFFLSTVALRARFEDDPSILEALDRIRTASLEAIEHQDVPFNRVVEAVRPPRLPGRHPLCQVMFVYQRENEAAPSFELGEASLEHTYVETETSKFDLTLFAAESGDAMEIILEYRTDLFDPASARRMLRRYEQILNEMVEAPQSRVSRINWLPGDERDRLLSDWQGADTILATPPSVVEQITSRIKAQPDAIAVACTESTMSYRQLDAISRSISKRLSDLGAGPGSNVAHIMGRGPAAVAAIVGILRAGAAYVPVDPNYPHERRNLILLDAGIQIAVTDQNSDLSETNVQDIVNVEHLRSAQDEPVELLSTACGPEQPAYLIYTSGSTGRPKGVVVTHGNLAYSTAARLELYSRPPERFLLIPSFSFDSSIAGIFWTLTQGGTLVVPTAEELRDPSRLREIIREHRVTDLLCVPTLYRELIRDASDQLQTLKRAIVAGESCPPDLVEWHFKYRPEAEMFNEYGPTEATVWATLHACSRGDAGDTRSVSIGRPIPNMKTFVLDSEFRPLPIGSPGELHLGGPGVTQGYWNRSDLTQERFVERELPAVGRIRLYRTGDLARWREDGNLEFMGRTDEQMKIRGYRIEAGEIEAALKRSPAIDDAVVVAASAQTDPSARSIGDHQRLVAYVLATPDHETPGSTELRQFLADHLPDFMIPSAFLAIDTFPVTPNGKVDRRALAARGIPSTRTHRAIDRKDDPGTEKSVEERLLQVWRTALADPSIEPDDDFFEAGGDSILAIQMVSEVARIGLEVQLTEFFQAPTVSQMAAIIESRSGGSKDKPTSTQIRPTGPVPLTAIQHWFFGLNLDHRERWNQARCLTLPANSNPETIRKALEEVIQTHSALRHAFAQKSGGWLQVRKTDPGPIGLESSDVAGKSASEYNGALDRVLEKLHRSMRLDAGPLIRAAHLRNWTLQNDLLVIAAHHLVVDVVSWNIILEDLATAIEQTRIGQPIELPIPPSDLATWSNALHEYAQTEPVLSEARQWIDHPWHHSPDLSLDFPEEDSNTEDSAEVIFHRLTTDETHRLTERSAQSNRADIAERLIASLVQALTQWLGAKSIRINLEGHGREPFEGGPDISRTVGWFTSTYPVLFELTEPDRVETTIRDVRQTLRRIPNKGFGFGLLKYLTVDPDTAREFESIPEPEVIFNYLGVDRMDTASAEHLPSAAQMFRHARAPKSRRPSIFELNSWISENCLELAFSYSRKLHRRETAESLMASMVSFLTEAASSVSSDTTDGLDAADFPDAGLGQDDLNRLLDRIN